MEKVQQNLGFCYLLFVFQNQLHPLNIYHKQIHVASHLQNDPDLKIHINHKNDLKSKHGLRFILTFFSGTEVKLSQHPNLIQPLYPFHFFPSAFPT